MKKITLLFTLLCVAALNGMENPERNDYKGFGGLSPEIQVMIIRSLNIHDTLYNIIKAIKATSLVDKELNEIVNGEYGNLAGFTALLHTLANKFPDATKENMATLFNTEIANKYLELNRDFEYRTGNLHNPNQTKMLDTLTQFIDQGADPDYTWNHSLRGTYFYHSILTNFYRRALISGGDKDAITAVESLLKKKTDPNYKFGQSGTLLNFAQKEAERLEGNDFGLLNLLKQYGTK